MYAESRYFISMLTAVQEQRSRLFLCLFDLCRKPYLKLKLPVSFQVVQESFSCPCLQLQGLGFSELPELIFGFIFMFLVFLIYLELFLWSSACVDLFGRPVSAVSVCLFVSVWTSVRTKVPL